MRVSLVLITILLFVFRTLTLRVCQFRLTTGYAIMKIRMLSHMLVPCTKAPHSSHNSPIGAGKGWVDVRCNWLTVCLADDENRTHFNQTRASRSEQ